MSLYDENGNFIEQPDSTRSLLKEIGIEVDFSKRRGRKYLLTKNNKELGWFTACQAHDKFLTQQ